MEIFSVIMLVSLIIFSISISIVKDLLSTVVIFMVYSLVMAVLWQQLNSPDLAITEAAVGGGITTFMFIAVIRRIKGEKK